MTFLLALLVTCGDDDEQSSGGALNYSGSIPRFSVDPLRDTGVELGAINFFHSWPKKFFNNMVVVPNAVAQSSRISCSSQNNFVNEAPQIYERAASNEGLDYAIQFYAQALFYDCNARQQVQDDGVSQTEEPDPNNPAEDIPILTAKVINSQNPEALTRFVSWTDIPESENVSGILVNKYLYDDGDISRTRIDLKINNGARSVWGVLHYNFSGGVNAYTKFAFREVLRADGSVEEHRVSGRHWDSTDQTVIIVKARAIAGRGVSIFRWRCAGVAVANINNPCSSVGPANDANYYDEDGNEITNATEINNSGLDRDPANDMLDIGDYFFQGNDGGTAFFHVDVDPEDPDGVVDLGYNPN